MPKKTEEIIPQEEPINPHLEAARKYARNEQGLIHNYIYKFNEDGSVAWEKMIPTKYIVLNKDRKAQIEAKYSRNFDELQTAIQDGTQDPEDIDNSFKLILLAGYKEVAKLRGFTQVNYHNNFTSPEYVAVNCEIHWVANYELGQKIRFSSLADAHINNVKGFFANFLNTLAENRAFVRCVRNFLNIHVVGADEIGGTIPTEENQSAPDSSFSTTDPRFLLEKNFNELNSEFKISWVNFAKHIEEKRDIEGAAKWKTVKDVPKEKAYDIIGLVKEQLEKKRAKLGN